MSDNRVTNTPGQPLTLAQAQVIALAAQGYPNPAIARRLGMSACTVKSHFRRAFLRLDARDRTQAVVLAILAGAIQLHTDGTVTAATPRPLEAGDPLARRLAESGDIPEPLFPLDAAS